MSTDTIDSLLVRAPRYRAAAEQIGQLETEHRSLLASVSRLDGAAADARPEILRTALGELHGLVYRHCSAERELLDVNGYGDRSRHLADHDVLKAELDAHVLRAETDAMGPAAVGSLLRFLEGWWANHVTHFDEPLFSLVLSTPQLRGLRR
jgi:hemerythrin-like metal-binding protein